MEHVLRAQPLAKRRPEFIEGRRAVPLGRLHLDGRYARLHGGVVVAPDDEEVDFHGAASVTSVVARVKVQGPAVLVVIDDAEIPLLGIRGGHPGRITMPRHGYGHFFTMPRQHDFRTANREIVRQYGSRNNFLRVDAMRLGNNIERPTLHLEVDFREVKTDDAEREHKQPAR